MMARPGIFIISLDFELYWGVRDKRTIEQYRGNLLGVRRAIPALLSLFAEYGIHATWATVGMLFASDADELKRELPRVRPRYSNVAHCPYRYLEQAAALDPRFHFAPDMIDLIRASPGQEIGTHTFSHYYCLESGQDAAAFQADLTAAMAVAARRNIQVQSLVFPRNQWNSDYLSSVADAGIRCFRGNESSWTHAAASNARQGVARRSVRLLDAYLNLTGQHTFSPADCAQQKPFNIPASRFLRPHAPRLAVLDGLRLQRITRALDHAAARQQAMHLWWHPHNFGVNLEANLRFLRRVLDHFRSLQQRGAIESLNMRELADRLEAMNR